MTKILSDSERKRPYISANRDGNRVCEPLGKQPKDRCKIRVQFMFRKYAYDQDMKYVNGLYYAMQ